MRFIYLKEISSTQKYLISLLKENKIKPPVCVWSEYQTNGIGSRGNSWIGKRGNLFFSFADYINKYDVPLQSLSVYFGYVLKKTLNEFGSKVVFKWPNDLYLSSKVGGVMTNIFGDVFVCGIGLNTKKTPKNDFSGLDIEIKNDKILKEFFKNLETISFKDVINDYKKEFERTKELFQIDGFLDDDGSLIKNGKKVYSRR